MLAHGVLGNSVSLPLPPANWVHRRGISCSNSNSNSRGGIWVYPRGFSCSNSNSRRDIIRFEDRKQRAGNSSSSSPGQQGKNVRDKQQQQPQQQSSYARICTKYVANRARIAAAASASLTETFGVTESGKFTLSDAALRQRGFEVLSSSALLDLDQLNSLFVKVGFPRRQKDKLARALEHTLSMVWLRELKTQRLVAFARATGDNVFNAIIWDVVVDPTYQGSGLGKVVIERLMADLVRKGISNIALYAEPDVVGFYRPLGFIADPDGIRAMAYQRRRR